MSAITQGMCLNNIGDILGLLGGVVDIYYTWKHRLDKGAGVVLSVHAI